MPEHCLMLLVCQRTQLLIYYGCLRQAATLLAHLCYSTTLRKREPDRGEETRPPRPQPAQQSRCCGIVLPEGQSVQSGQRVYQTTVPWWCHVSQMTIYDSSPTYIR